LLRDRAVVLSLPGTPVPSLHTPPHPQEIQVCIMFCLSTLRCLGILACHGRLWASTTAIGRVSFCTGLAKWQQDSTLISSPCCSTIGPCFLGWRRRGYKCTLICAVQYTCVHMQSSSYALLLMRAHAIPSRQTAWGRCHRQDGSHRPVSSRAHPQRPDLSLRPARTTCLPPNCRPLYASPLCRRTASPPRRSTATTGTDGNGRRHRRNLAGAEVRTEQQQRAPDGAVHQPGSVIPVFALGTR